MKQKREWPHNGRPSKRHVWEIADTVDHCKRCGCMYSYKAMDGVANIYCAPRPQWLLDHPKDDGRTGP